MLKRCLSTTVARETAEELSAACKSLERKYEKELEPDLPCILRLDGVNFKKLTRTLQKPFDPRFTRAMILTAKDLLEHFSCTTAFTQSDEISLFMFPGHTVIPWNGRTLKMASIAAAMASVKFCEHSGLQGWFDCRIFSCPNDDVVRKVAAWRHLYDCRRNAINAAGSANFTHKSLQNLSIDQVVGRLWHEKGIKFYDHYPSEATLGTFLKKMQFGHQGFNPIHQQPVQTVRSRVEGRSIDFAKHEDLLKSVLCAKFWEDGHPKGNLVSLESKQNCLPESPLSPVPGSDLQGMRMR